MKWWPNSREERLRINTWALSLSLFLTVCVLLGCGFEPKFDTPIATVETYVWAYNNNNGDLMKKCGFDADLYKLFRIRTDVGVGEPTYEPVRDIQMEVLSEEWARPKNTRKFTSDRILILFKFTSKDDSTFQAQRKLLLVKRRNAFMDFSDPIRWQLMSLENARLEEAGT
ncbi:MAG: hypothetical protein JW941_00960 [Candidatus Coatesbacteria bacterium]|nr:hypothetical protein [Candidatus Coatesbacteria bacterium]